jgi:predicted transcriptional regulator
MALKVFSVKADEEKIAGLELLAKEKNTTRNALMVEAIDSLLSGGMEKIMEEKLMACLKNYLGFQDKEGFQEAVEEHFGSMLVDLIDSRLKVLYSIDLSEELQAGSLAALVAAQRPSPKIISKETINEALGSIEESLIKGEAVQLDELATKLQADKQLLSIELAKIGVKTERKRVGGEKRSYYLPDKLEAVKKAMGA